MDGYTTLEADLRALERKWEQITDIPESPRSLMDVIEYSLGSQKKAEVYVNRLLAYFLDPEEPHGMDTEFLRAVLDGLPDECDFQEDTHDLSDVVVDDQVRVEKVVNGTAESAGIVDLLIEVPNEWFLMIELKFSAKDTQTKFYYREATHVGGRSKVDYEAGEYYLYLHQSDQPAANESNFTNWRWQEFRNDVLEPFLFENAARLPQRTVTQLREFNDDIESISGMTDQQQNEEEKVELYLEHYDAISDVTDTFDDRWERFSDHWGRQLGEALERDGHGSASDFDEDVTGFVLATDDTKRGDWRFRTSSSDWGMIFKDGWWRHVDDLSRVLHSRADDRNDARIGFHHRLGRNRDLALGERTLKVYFRNMGANDQEFIDEFVDTFHSRTSEIGDLLPPRAEITGIKDDMLVATYNIEVADDQSFFDAYIESLNEAFVNLVVDNEALISVLDDIYYETLESVYGVSIHPD